MATAKLYEGRGSSQQEAYENLQQQAGEKARVVGTPVYTVTIMTPGEERYSSTDKSFEVAYGQALREAGLTTEGFDPTKLTLEVVAAAKFKGQGAGAAPSSSRDRDLTGRLF